MPVQTVQQFKDLGAAEVSFNSVVLGKTVENPGAGTHGGVGVKYAVASKDTMRDSLGSNPFDSIAISNIFQVVANLSGLSLVQLKEVIPGATLSTGAQKQLILGNPVGISARDNAKELIIKPILADVVSVDETEWIRVPLAYPSPELDFSFDYDNQKGYAVNFKCFNDLTTGTVATIGQDST